MQLFTTKHSQSRLSRKEDEIPVNMGWGCCFWEEVGVKKLPRLIRTQEQTGEPCFRQQDTSLTDWYQAAS